MGCALKGRGEALPASCDLPDPISGLQGHASGYTSNVDALQNGWAALSKNISKRDLRFLFCSHADSRPLTKARASRRRRYQNQQQAYPKP
jgi:hypothetical protein